MKRLPVAVSILLISSAGSMARCQSAGVADAVRATERAFARSMAERDSVAFEGFLSDEAVFMTGDRVLRGPSQILSVWGAFFEGEAAPFAWSPEVVEVLESGTLALSSGPVLGPDGKRIGTFNSVWRREADGRWLIVFDKGCPPCNCEQ